MSTGVFHQKVDNGNVTAIDGNKLKIGRSAMNGLPYLAAIGGGFLSVVVVRWGFRRYNIRSRRLLAGVVIGGALCAGYLAYFALGFLFVMIHTDQSQNIWVAVVPGFRVGAGIIALATLVATRLFRRLIKPPSPRQVPEDSVRERLLKARADLKARIVQVQSSPVMNYRGGVPETDIIVKELEENLSEIDAALAPPEQKN